MSYKRFDTEDVVVSAESVTAPVWSSDAVTLTNFFTSSTQIGGTSADYYYDVYQTSSTLSTARVQFSIAYADKQGSGSLYYNDNVAGKSPSSTIYGQYRNLALGDEEANFTFGSITSEHFYVIAIDRARYKEKLLPGTLDLKLHVSASGAEISLTDNSQVVSTTTFNDAGRVYELVSGSTGTVYTGLQTNGYSVNSGSYGKLLPDIGILLLNGNALDAPAISGGLALNTTRTANTAGVNLSKFYNLLTLSGSFRIQSEETISSNFIFVRARNSEFNYSTNPSIITGSGELRHNIMINSPQSYITAVGLYNDNNDLLAVAKLSRPLLKDFTKESLVRIKLDY
tara:strand:- start:1332 stop:2354 length:1023 start_codon:yes stop_codon:yes gene_type:complete